MSKLSAKQMQKLFDMASKAKDEGKSLSEVFSKFAQETGKAKGSVRNLYYKTFKLAGENDGIKREYLADKNLFVGQIIGFTSEEEDKLLRQILSGVVKGKSVRRSILDITADEKLALRYQNKYRNLLKNDSQRVEKIKEQLEIEYGKKITLTKKDNATVIEKLKREINGLCERIARAEKMENAQLRLKLKRAEEENMQLKAILSEKLGRSNLIEIFDSNGNCLYKKKN